MIRSAVTVCLVPEAAAGPFVFHGDLPTAAREAKRLGFDALEIFPPDATAIRLPDVARTLGDNGMALAAVGTGAGWIKHKLTLASGDATVRAAALHFVREILVAAAAHGAPTILGSMQGRWADGVTRDDVLRYLGESLISLNTLAEQLDTTLLYEPLNRYETNLFTRLGDAATFLHELRLPRVKLLADLFHMNIEESDPAATIAAVGATIGHVHFADSNRQAAGMGHTDFGKVADALRSFDYDGYVSAEVFPTPDALAAAGQTMTAFRQFFPRTA